MIGRWNIRLPAPTFQFPHIHNSVFDVNTTFSPTWIVKVRVRVTRNQNIVKKFNIGDSWCHTIELINSNTSKDFLLPPPSVSLTHTLLLSHTCTQTQTDKEGKGGFTQRPVVLYSKDLFLDENKFCILCGKTSSQSLKEDRRCTRSELRCKVSTGSDGLGVPKHQDSKKYINIISLFRNSLLN